MSAMTATLNAMEAFSCPTRSIDVRLRDAGLRPTRQRIALGGLLFAKGDRHLTAEDLHEEAGMLRVLAVETAKTYFDTNTSDHHHFFVEGDSEVLDIDTGDVEVGNLPEPPEGMEIAHVDVIIRLRKKT
jgi:Fur family transcriptional regulator, iron response regulator